MKIRCGFISNSSSSSFIITGNIVDVATHMLDVVSDYFRRGAKRARKNLEKALLNPDVLAGKLGITLKSCSYDTFVIVKGKDVYIDTCNNYYWGLEVFKLKRSGGGSDYNDNVHKFMKNKMFIDIDKNNLIHSYPKNKLSIRCPKDQYDGYIITENGLILCELCGERIGMRK